MSIVKTKSIGVKKRMMNPKHEVHFVRPAHVDIAKTSLEFRSRQQRLKPLLRSLKNPIELLTDYITQEPLTKEEKLSLLSLLHTLNLQRDTLERMKESLSVKDLTMVSEHLFKKMQSSVSEA